MKRAPTRASRLTRVLLAGSMAAAVLCTQVGCEKPDWEDPAYVETQLQDSDATKRRMALEYARKLPDEKKSEIVPALSALYLEAGVGQKEAMTMLVALRDARAEKAYLEEVRTNATGYAAAAAEAVGHIGATSAVPGLLEALKSTDSAEIKEGILRGLVRLPDPQVVSPLVELLELDPDNNPIALHAYACEILGEVGQRHPEAFDDKAKKTLVRGVFLANNRGQNVGRECGLAVQQVGESMVPALLETFRGEHKEVQQLLMAYNTAPDYGFTSNHSKLVATVRLAALRAGEAVEPLIADLAGEKEAPAEVRGQHAVSWRLKEGQSTDEIILGLGDIGNPAARPILEQVLTGGRNTAWDDITDGMIELQLRQNAAQALNRLGDRAALPVLMKMAREGVVIDIERRAVMLQQRGQPISMLERYQFNWMAAQYFAMLATGEHRAEFDKLVAATKEDELKKKYESFLPAFDVAAECGGKADDAARAACYGEKLGDENAVVREKAAWELARLAPAAAGPVLVANLGTGHLDTREIIEFGLYRAPSKEAIAKIDELLEQEASRSTQDYRLDHNRLRLLRAWLANNVGPTATSER